MHEVKYIMIYNILVLQGKIQMKDNSLILSVENKGRDFFPSLFLEHLF